MSVDVELDRQAQDEADRQAAIDVAAQGWTPIGDKVLLATLRPLERRIGTAGLVAPGHDSPLGEKVERQGRLGRVVAVGPQAGITVGTKVYCGSWAGAKVEIDGHHLLVISENELLLVEAPVTA